MTLTFRQYSVGFKVVCVEENVTGTASSFQKRDSGDFRRGFAVLELENIAGGVYNIAPCTFKPGQEGPYFLTVSAAGPITLTSL